MTTSNEHNNAPAVPQGWRDAASAALTLLNKTQRALGNNLAKHPADHFATVGELMGMHDCRDGFLVRSGLSGILNDTDPSTNEPWPKSEPVRLPHARTGRVYLAGPMTGISELNFPAFNQEAERLRAEGLQVLNPADHGIVDGADWADYLRHDIAGLASCERIHLLRGWTKSKGACLEMTIAKALGMTVTYQVDAEMEHSNAPAVQQGWKLVPVEPTRAMWAAGYHAGWSRVDIYSAMLAAAPTPAPAQGEPFGYFRAEPFGWTDCAKDDEGAIALYERPQEVGLTDEEIEAIAQKHMSTVGDHWCNEEAIRERHAEDFARAIIAALRAKEASCK